jgi:hypothetical protein
VVLQDLDNSAKSYNPIQSGITESGSEEEKNGDVFMTFQNVTGSRFSLTSRQVTPPIVFEEIILGEPDR